jgi:hypothetical protein
LAGNRTAGVFACVMVLVGAISLLSAGCGGSSNNSGVQSSRAALVGTWTKSGLNARGRFVSCPNTITVEGVLVDSCVQGETITFNNNGTYSVTYPSPRFINLATESGNWTLIGNNLVMTRTSTGYDANNDNAIAAAEITDLVSVTNANGIPSNPRQRVVMQVRFVNGTLELTPVTQSVRDGSGNTVVNSDGTVNAEVNDSTGIYTR